MSEALAPFAEFPDLVEDEEAMRKLLICPYFGPMPPWMKHYWDNAFRLRQHGYDWLVDRDEEGFRERVKSVLGIECPPMAGTGKVWDFRPALGLLYEKEVRGYEFWGHTDFDCVYGRVEQWVTDEFLAETDLHSNHVDYVCGCWSLYRNIPFVNELFQLSTVWQQVMESPVATGWVETEYTTVVDSMHAVGELRRDYTTWQTQDLNSFKTLHLDADGSLWEGANEVMMAHFRRTKVYPEGCK